MATKNSKRYKCPYCDYRGYRSELIDHVEDEHEDMIPKGYSASRVVYNTINKKDHGTCMICHKETKWDENKQRYDTLCGNPKCKKQYVEMVRSRMVHKYGTYNLLKDPNFQKKMLEGRSISGKYKFEDGGSIGYVGSYEKKFLEFMDKFLHIKSYDIISPGPNIPYMYKGKEHVWITDFLYEPYNLVFDIKDGGDNPNTRDMKEYREKQIAKEKAIANYGDYNYIRLTDNKFEQLILLMMELKEKDDNKPIIRINESFLNESNQNLTIFNAYHLEPKIKPRNKIYGGWDEELYSKSIEDAINNDIKSKYELKDKDKVSAYVYTAGKDLNAIYLGTITIFDKNNPNDWEWEEQETLSNDDYNYIKENPMESTSLYTEEVRFEDDKLPKFIYHISYINHDGETFEPRVYDNDNVKKGMERRVKRVCFSDSVTRALYSIFPNGAYDADFYVHIPDSPCKVYKTNTDDIYDSDITHELWIKEPVKMKCIGKIHVSGVSDKTHTIEVDKDKAGYGKKKYHETRWRWIEKYEDDKTLYESHIISSKEDNNMIYESYNEIPKFESDIELFNFMKKNISYKKYTKLMSPEEVYRYKKGSCHDQVMFELYCLRQLKLKPKALFLIEYNDTGRGNSNVTHSLVYYEKNNKIYWFENAWGGQEGIHEFNSLDELKKKIIDLHYSHKFGNVMIYPELEFASFKTHKPGETLQELVNKCLSIKESYLYESSNILNQRINESVDKSKLDKNFEKKSGIKFKYIDIKSNKSKVDKYLSEDKSYQNTYKKYLDEISGEIVIDEENDILAGYVFVIDKFITPVFVVGKYRGYSLGDTLVKDAVSKYGAKRLWVYKDNEVAINLYKKYGFKTYIEDEEPSIFMATDKKYTKDVKY